jgi:hypothetical protein
LTSCAALTAFSVLVLLATGVPTASATPSVGCAGASGVLTVTVSGTSVGSDSLKITESSGNYSLSLTSGGSTTAVCAGTFPDSGISGFPTVKVTGTLLSTTFVPVDGGLTFQGEAGVANTLDLSTLSLPGAPSISVAGSMLWGPNLDFFSNITTFVGSAAGNTDFLANSVGGFTFTGLGSGNLLDLGSAGGGVTASVPDGTVTLNSGTDHFSGISLFGGSISGGMTVVAGADDLTFFGQGNGNELDLSQVPTTGPSPLWVNVSGVPTNSPYGVLPSNAAESGLGTYHFTAVSTFIGSGTGNTDFLGDGAGGCTFTGGGSGNVLDLGAAGPGVSVSLATHKVTGLTSSDDTFTGISTVNGPGFGGATFTGGVTSGYTFNGAGNGNTFVPGSGDGTFNAGLGAGNILDFSNVGTSGPTPLQVNVSGSTVGGVNNNSARVGGATYTFTGFNTFVGPSSGNTTYNAPGSTGGNSFGFAGSGNTLDLTDLPAGTTVTPGTVSWAAKSDTFSGVATIDGSASGGTTFKPNAAPGYGFNGFGANNVLDLTATGANVTASVPDGTVAMDSGTDDFSGIDFFIGSSSGGTTVVAGGTALTFQGQALGNSIDFSQVLASQVAPLWVNVSGGPVASAYGPLLNNRAESTFATYSFSDVASFSGSSSGSTTFAAGSTGPYHFSGGGSGNLLDLSTAGTGITVSLPQTRVSGTVGGNDTFSGIQTFDGASAGGTTFIGGNTSGFTFNGAGNANTFSARSGSGTFNGGAGSGNKLDLSQVLALQLNPLSVNVSGGFAGGLANNTAGVGSTTYTFSNIATFVGAVSGNTTFFAGPSGGFTFTGGGVSGNVLDLSAAPGTTTTVNGNSLADPGEVTGLGNGTDSFSDIQSFVGTTVLQRLSVAKAGSGSGSVTSLPAGIDCGSTCTHNFTDGTSVTLRPVAAAGSLFAGWSGACTGTGNCSVPMTAAASVTATFNLLPNYTLSVTKAGTGAGTVTSLPTGITCGSACSRGYTSGTSVTLTAAAAAGSTFAGWSGACTGTGNCSVAMTAARAVTATFTLLPTFSLSVTTSGNGSGGVTSEPAGIDCGSTCSASFGSGASVTLTAAAAPGSTFEGWRGACSGTSICTVAMTAAQSVDASFRKDCVVPKIKGKSLKIAGRLIRGHNCSVGNIGHAYSNTVKRGAVISQKPAPGRQRPPGAKVNLVVSKGKRR